MPSGNSHEVHAGHGQRRRHEGTKDLVVPRTRLQLGNRAFSVAGPVAWNSLPLDIRSAPTLSTVSYTHLTLPTKRIV